MDPYKTPWHLPLEEVWAKGASTLRQAQGANAELFHVKKLNYGGKRPKLDKPSGIVNDPNDWGKEHGDPRYIVNLVKRITRVSVETVSIVKSLPPLDILTEQETTTDKPVGQGGVPFQ